MTTSREMSGIPSRTPSGIPWWPEDRATREGSGLDREQIVAAALDLLDRHGLDALSMRRIAQALDVGTMSLYWYVPNKEQLLAEVVDAVMAGVELPDPDGEWVAELRRVAWSVRRTLDAHREVARLLLGGVLAGPSLLRLKEATLTLLRRAGFDDEHAVHALALFTHVAVGFGFVAELGGRTRHRDPRVAAEAERKRWTRGHNLRDLDAARYPTVVELAALAERPPDEERYAFALETMLAGLRAAHEARTPG